MKLLDVYPADIHAVIEYSKDDIDKLLTVMDRVKIHFDRPSEPKIAEAADFFVDKFYPEIKRIHELMGGK